jgi:hypothetical protein
LIAIAYILNTPPQRYFLKPIYGTINREYKKIAKFKFIFYDYKTKVYYNALKA